MNIQDLKARLPKRMVSTDELIVFIISLYYPDWFEENLYGIKTQDLSQASPDRAFVERLERMRENGDNL